MKRDQLRNIIFKQLSKFTYCLETDGENGIGLSDKEY
jgi:hypothetical protein